MVPGASAAGQEDMGQAAPETALQDGRGGFCSSACHVRAAAAAEELDRAQPEAGPSCCRRTPPARRPGAAAGGSCLALAPHGGFPGGSRRLGTHPNPGRH
ncbi:hypothetical protein P7K49_036039 [Saguinus oedipus]|uniref:Uncharacterized protein n=1 Tax=Saguinus oedipus TaxID=9490 RepID=A0ABQ9TPB1_SAGOE|nr:hypothetical protein P7K49_036039 [Saguinus oedipus]